MSKQQNFTKTKNKSGAESMPTSIQPLAKLYREEIRDISDFIDLPIFWTMKLLADATRRIINNYIIGDIKGCLDKHLETPGCLNAYELYETKYDFPGDNYYTNYQEMRDKYRKKDYTEFEQQTRKILDWHDANCEYITQLDRDLEKLREQMRYVAGFNDKLFGLECTDKRNYLNEKNKPKCELCATPACEFGQFCVGHPEMRQTYQQVISEITRLSEENKQSQRPEYIELLRMLNESRWWFLKPEQPGSRRWVY
jgi:hypothetical protein